MALLKTKLTDVISVTGISTVGIFTAGTTPVPVGTSGTTYVRTVLMHNTGLATATSSIYIYPDGVTDVSVGQTAYRVARVDLASNETYFYEMNYPMTLTSGDKIIVEITEPSIFSGGTGIGSAINYQVICDTSS